MDGSDRAEFEELVSHREATYALLARLFQAEVDAKLLGRICEIDLSLETGTPEIGEGYALLRAFLDQAGDTTIIGLAADYARVFLGVGPREGDGAFPYESVYTSPEGLMMQEARHQVASIYREFGLDRVSGFNVPEDHLALELGFMAYLCGEVAKALRAGDVSAARGYLEEQQRFIEGHLVPWVPAFCADVQRIATTGFYKAAAKITTGYLAMERNLVGRLLDEL